jgi:hypothetical protein
MWRREIRPERKSWNRWTDLRKFVGSLTSKRRGGEYWLLTWKLLFYKRKLAEGRNRGCGG